MASANRIHRLLADSPIHYWNSLLQQQAARHQAALEANHFRSKSQRVWGDQNSVTFEFDLPGHALEDFEVTLDKSELSISVKEPESQEQESVTLHLQERRHLAGTFTVTLPFRAEADQVETTYARGVLKVTAQRPAADLPRQLAVKPGE